MKRFVIGDIHGAHKALIQCLERSNFNRETDLLISLGDVADGWSQVSECFEELFKIKNLIYILGNHDEWLLDWFNTGHTPNYWTSQGGQMSINSYNNNIHIIDWKKHRDFIKTAKLYYILDNKLFVHGGIDWHFHIDDQPIDILLWDRHLFSTACMWQEWYEKDKPKYIVKDYDEVFIGHTTTTHSHPNMEPVHVSNVWNLDQGAGWEGKLSIMNIDSKEFWQSDIVKTLYPNEKGRR